MGQEIACRVQFDGKCSAGKVLLESKEILFRGDFRLLVPFASIESISAADGRLQVKTSDGIAVFELGDRAEKWRDKILNPKSVVDKLGVKPGDTVTLHGSFDGEFLETLQQRGAKIGTGSNVPWIIFKAQSRGDLARLKTVAKTVKGSTALWLVYPKGTKTITEGDVREAGAKQGLKDVKVASFSETHTALKFVLPKRKR